MAQPSVFWARLARLQTRYAGSVVIASLLLAALCLPLTARLGLNSAWTALLPEGTPSVEDLAVVKARFGGMSTLTVAVESRDRALMEQFIRALAPRLEAMGPPVRHVAWTMAPYEAFVEEHRQLYVDLRTLEGVRNDLEDRIQYEKASLNPFFLHLEDEEPPTLEQIVARAEQEAAAKGSFFERYPNGFYAHPDGTLMAILVRTYLESDDTAGGEALMAAVQREVDALLGGPFLPSKPSLHVELAGDIPEALAEHDAVAEELIIATVSTVILVMFVLVLFFRRLRAIPLLGLQLLAPVALTFAVAELAVDYLNASTAFLGSIVVGNGVNPGIIWLARYFEERRRGRDVEAALRETHVETWSATLAAAAGASTAYASLIVTDFRGFRDFGIIGSTGMMLGWAGALFILPAAAALWDRHLPMRFRDAEARDGLYGIWLERLVTRHTGRVLAFSSTLGVVCFASAVYGVWSDPIEYDMTKLRSAREDSEHTSALNDRINEFTSKTETGTIVAALTPNLGAAAAYEAKLEAARDAGKASFGTVNSVFDLLPRDQERKLELLADIRRMLLELRERVAPEDQARIDENLPADGLRVLTVADLPKGITAPFTEKDGRVGTIVVTEQSKPGLNWDGRYLIQWTKDVRRVPLEDGSRPPVAGRPAVFADLLDVVWHDGPVAVGVSFAATLLILVFAFQSLRDRLTLLVALLLGVVWLAGTMALFEMRLNFLNFVAFPITCGNGIDYGVNVLRRYKNELGAGRTASEAARTAVRASGGAVALCSLTTVIGYMSLYASANKAINSFGAAMSIAEVMCVLAAVITLPAYLLWRANRRPA